MTQKITMYELARRAGCSQSQVSRAFNGQPNVAPEVRARILKIAREVNYRNSTNNHKIRVAFVSLNLGSFFGIRLCDKVREEMRRRNWLFHAIDESQLNDFSDCFFDGAISVAYDRQWARIWSEKRNLPLVMLNSYGSYCDHICSVEPDPLDAARQVLTHLKSLGHRRIARLHLVGSDANYHRGQAEFLQAAMELQLHYAEDIELVQSLIRPENIAELRSRGFTAIYVVHQSLAIQVCSVLRELKLKIPDDLSVVTYEVTECSEYLEPPYTTIDFDFAAIAKRACDELRERMLSHSGTSGAVRIANILNIRKSTGPVPASASAY